MTLSTRQLVDRGAELLGNQLATFRATPGFAGFMDDPHRFILLRAANQCGKTRHVIARMARVARSAPLMRIRIVAPSADMSNQVIQRYVWEMLCDDIARGRYVAGKGFTEKFITLHNGTEIQFRSYNDDPQTGEGDQLDLVILDEVPKRGWFDVAVARVTRRRGSVWISCTPVGRPIEWLRDIVEPKDEEGKRRAWIAGQERPEGVTWKQYVVAFEPENVPWMDSDAVREQILAVEAGSEAAQRLRGAWEGVTADRIFTGFSTDSVAPQRPQVDQRWQVALGIDHGLLAGHQVAVLMLYSGTTVYVLDEYVSAAAESFEDDAFAIYEMLTTHGMGLAQVSKCVGDVNKVKAGVPINRKLSKAFQSIAGSRRPPIRVRPAGKGRGSRDWGFRLINYALRRGDMTIHPRCTHVLDSLRHWQGTSRGDDERLSHAADALRYIAMDVLAGRPEYKAVRFV